MAKKSKKSKAQKEAEKKHDELLESYQSQDVLAKYVLFPNVVRYLDNVYGKNQYKLTVSLAPTQIIYGKVRSIGWSSILKSFVGLLTSTQQPLNTMRYEIKGPWQLTQVRIYNPRRVFRILKIYPYRLKGYITKMIARNKSRK